MKNFISPLYIRTNTISEERICIGLFVSSDERLYFAWSETKVKLADRLIEGDVYPILKKNFQTIEKEVESCSYDRPGCANKYSYNYFSYLDAYNDGLLEFKKPSILPKAVTIDQFQSLYKLYVGEAMSLKEPSTKATTLYQKVKHYLQDPVFAEKADKNYKVSETVISTIYRPQLVDFISCNGSLLTGYSIDFTASPTTIENRLYEFRALVEGLSAFAEKKRLKGPGKYIAYFEPPQEDAQVNIFRNALQDKSKNFELKPVDELAGVIELLERNNYRKFSELIKHSSSESPQLVG
jgi:hypothetical protein